MESRRNTEAWSSWPFKPWKSQPHLFCPLLLFFLLMESGASGEDSAPGMRVIGMVGRLATFHLNISVGAVIENIFWNGPYGAIVLVMPTGDPLFLNKSYTNRLFVNYSSLSINNLTLKDTGSYKTLVNLKDMGATFPQDFTLHVYEQLQEPQVTVKSVTVSENAVCTITLACSVKGDGKDVDYSWTSVGPHVSESYVNSTLSISWVPCDPDLSCACTAQNPVSQRKSHPVFVRQLCTGAGAARGEPEGEMVVGILGESIILPLTCPAGWDMGRVVWMFNTSVIYDTWEDTATDNPLTQFMVPDKYEVWVADQDYSLRINQVRMENAGPYHAYVCSQDSRVTNVTHITLLVYQRLKKPKVTQDKVFTEDGFCRIQLVCSVEDGGPNVTYQWTSSLKKGIDKEGPVFQFSWRHGENDPIFNCMASNPVSSSSQTFISSCPGPKRHRKLWLILSLTVSILLLCIGISTVYIWRKKRHSSTTAFISSQVEVPTATAAYSNQYMASKANRHQPPSYSSSDRNGTTEEDEEELKMPSPGHGRDDTCDQFDSEDSSWDSSSERQAEHELTISGGKALASGVKGDTVYAHVFLKSEGKNPVTQKQESSVTIYSSIQNTQNEVLPPQNDPKSSEINTYENFT